MKFSFTCYMHYSFVLNRLVIQNLTYLANETNTLSSNDFKNFKTYPFTAFCSRHY